MPRIKPDPPSALRRSAYQSETPIPGPHQDPEGWKTLPPILINGTVFSHRSVQIKCTVSPALLLRPTFLLITLQLSIALPVR